MSPRPSISLLVPCYNAERYIRDLLACARAQSWPYHEIICYDDASADRTVSLIEAEDVAIIRSNSNRGPAHARRSLLAAATGDFVHFHDADDLISSRFIQAISPLLDDQTVAVCARAERDEKGNNKTIPLAHANFSDSLELVVRNFIHFNQAVFPAALAKRHMELAVELRILEDRLAFLSMAANGSKFRYVDEVLTTIVRRSGSVTASQSHADGMDCLYTYWQRAAPLASEHIQALAEYVSYTAWCYYFEDPAVYPQVKRVMGAIRARGITPTQSFSRAERLLATFFSPETIYLLRRTWATRR